MNKLGFGFLRLSRLNADDETSIDDQLLCQMADEFLAGGGSYFDTAYTYLNGASEEAVNRTLVQRHPRDSFCLADKLPGYLVKEPEDCERFFQIQSQRCWSPLRPITALLPGPFVLHRIWTMFALFSAA